MVGSPGDFIVSANNVFLFVCSSACFFGAEVNLKLFVNPQFGDFYLVWPFDLSCKHVLLYYASMYYASMYHASMYHASIYYASMYYVSMYYYLISLDFLNSQAANPAP